MIIDQFLRGEIGQFTNQHAVKVREGKPDQFGIGYNRYLDVLLHRDAKSALGRWRSTSSLGLRLLFRQHSQELVFERWLFRGSIKILQYVRAFFLQLRIQVRQELVGCCQNLEAFHFGFHAHFGDVGPSAIDSLDVLGAPGFHLDQGFRRIHWLTELQLRESESRQKSAQYKASPNVAAVNRYNLLDAD